MNPALGSKKLHHSVVNLSTYKALLVALMGRELNQAEIAEQTGMAPGTISNWLRILKTRPNLIYISAYKKAHATGVPVAYYKFGFMEQDVLRPKPLTAAETCRRYRAKKRAMAELLNLTEKKRETSRI